MSPSFRPPNFDDWVDDAEEAQSFNRIWGLLRQTDEEQLSSYDVDSEWNQLSDQLDLDTDAGAGTPASERRAERSPRSSHGVTSQTIRQWTRTIAVAVGLLLCVAAGAWWLSTPVSIQTPAGTQTIVTLPDGSTAELNGSTTLSYSRGFAVLPGIDASTRAVSLEGEAFFSVVSGERPFTVETSNARIEVLGTKFNVQARTTDGPPETRVVVASGQVRVASFGKSVATEEASVTLEGAGQSSRVRGGAAPTVPEVVELRYVEAWRQGGFAVFDAPLPTILRELERRFGTPLALGVPADQTEPMSLHYARDVQLETVLRDIGFTQNLSFRRTSQGYELVRSKE